MTEQCKTCEGRGTVWEDKGMGIMSIHPCPDCRNISREEASDNARRRIIDFIKRNEGTVLNSSEIAREAGVSKTDFTAWLNFKEKMAGPVTLKKIAAVIGMKYEKLISPLEREECK